MSEVAQNMGWAVIFSFLGGAVGIGLVMAAALALPRLIERLTPNLDEESRAEQLQWYYGRTRAI
jgi:hypothetical protein